MAVLNVTGSASVTNGSTTVTIVGGNLVAAGVTAGIFFAETGLGGAIGTVNSNTELDLVLPYAGTTDTGLDFTISIDSAVLETATSNARAVAALLDQINPIASFTTFSNGLMENVDAGEWRTGLELGSIATQAANAVTITGGAMNGVTIGGSTPAPGTFTALTSTGIDDNATGNAITISASNLVGYGTSNPRSRLEIAGSYSDGPTLGSTTGMGTAYYRASDPGYGLQFGVSATGYSWIQEGRIDTAAVAYGLMLQPAGGKVGIRKTAATCELDVNGAIRCGSYTVGTVPSASSVGAGTMIYVTNEAGGATPAFSDGTNWRRASDRAIIS